MAQKLVGLCNRTFTKHYFVGERHMLILHIDF